MCSAVPIHGIADLEGIAFRGSEVRAEVLAYFGAGTVWIPGDEIYTMLASGAIDACHYGEVPTMIDMGFDEVTKYWVKKPLLGEVTAIPFTVNTKVWNELPDDLKCIVQTAIKGSTVISALDGQFMIDKAWRDAEDLGIEIIEWSDEDCAEFYEGFRVKTQEYRTDPIADRMATLLEPYMKEMGYWEK